MSKYLLLVKYCDDDYYWMDDEWKTYVSDDLDENVVILPSRYTRGIEEAAWYKDAKELIDELENNYYDLEDFKYQFDDQFAEDKLEDVFNAYENCDKCDSPEFIMSVCKILYPWLDLDTATIRGSMQSEWADIIYIKDSIDVDLLEDWYYGNVYNIGLYVLDESELDEEGTELLNNGDYESLIQDGYADLDTNGVMAYSEYFEMYRDLKHGLAEYFGIPEEDIIAVIDE